MNWWDRLTSKMFRSTIDRMVLARTEDYFAIASGLLDGGHVAGRMDWEYRAGTLDNVLSAWLTNPYIRRMTNLATSHIVGRGIRIRNRNADIDNFVLRIWNHPKNKGIQIPDLVDEITRAGEWFFILFPHPEIGIQFIRPVPARWVTRIETDEDDYLSVRRYWVDLADDAWPEGRPFKDVSVAEPDEPAMIHFALNRPVGAVRSWSGDLDTALPILTRYMRWLRSRSASAESRNAWAWVMSAANQDRVKEMQEKYKGGLKSGSIFIKTPEEDLTAVSSRIDAADASPDGRMMRQGVATGGNVAPHMIGDTEGATRSAAAVAHDPSLKFYEMRQSQIVGFFYDLTEAAVRRGHASGGWHRAHNRRLPDEGDWRWDSTLADLTRADNTALSAAALTIVNALSKMKGLGWVDDETAIRWIARFAGEVDPEKVIERLGSSSIDEKILGDERLAVQAGNGKIQ